MSASLSGGLFAVTGPAGEGSHGVASYVLLLKGVNVGGNRRVAMADLRQALSGLGFTDVATLLQSGNAVFNCPPTEPAKLESRIEQGLLNVLGLRGRCLVRTAAELRSVVDAHPLADVATNGSKMMAHFLSAAPEPKLLAANDPTTLAPGEIVMGDRVIYQWCPNGLLEAPVVATFVEKRLNVIVSARNWNTVTKLAAMLDA